MRCGSGASALESGAMWRQAVERLPAPIRKFLRVQFSEDAVSTFVHVVVLFLLVSYLRPILFRGVTSSHYEASSIFVSIVNTDIDLIVRAAKRHAPAVPEIIVFLPLAVFVFTQRKLRWTDWEHGEELRLFVMGVMAVFVFSASTFQFNMYLNRGHFLDRGILIAFFALSWWYPIVLPIAMRCAFVLMKEVYLPIPQHDFEFRAVAEILAIFSVFVWASIVKSFKPKHFLPVAIGSYAAYYYSGGMAKHNMRGGSWIDENHISNLAAASYVRGWPGFVPENVFVWLTNLCDEYNTFLAITTMVIEVGALVSFFLHPRITRWAFFSCFVLNLSIFLLTGICFWKYMATALIAFFWMGKQGKPLVNQMHKYKAVMLLAIASVYYCDQRIWYTPQVNLAWWDTRLMDNYEMYAVGHSGKKYLVNPTYFAPLDFMWTQGDLCSLAPKERRLTGIYATTGSYNIMKRLQAIESPKAALAWRNRSRTCNDKKHTKRRRTLNKFLKRFFTNVNQHGKRHTWLDYIGRPGHLQLYPQGDDQYDGQEQVKELELYVYTAVYFGGQIHRSERHLATTIKIQ